MSALAFSVLGSHPEPFAAAPQLTLRVRVDESSGADVYAIALRAQIMLEPQRRRYADGESAALVDLFGTPERYANTLRPLLWTHASQMVPAFSGSTEIDLPVPCSYDFEVAAHKYLSALEGGDIPLNLLFSGTLLLNGPAGVACDRVSWNCEARYNLPASVWRATMDAFFPDSAWLRIDRSTFDELCRYKAAQAVPTWAALLSHLLDSAAARIHR